MSCGLAAFILADVTEAFNTYFVLSRKGVFADSRLEHRANNIVAVVSSTLQTVGAVAVTASDIGLDQFGKRFPVRALLFAIGWIAWCVVTAVASIQSRDIWHLVPALPFTYFLVRRQPILHVDPGYPSYSSLFATSLFLDGTVEPLLNIIRYIPNGYQSKRTIHLLIYSLALLTAIAFYAAYWVLVKQRSRRLALTTAIYGYLLMWGILIGGGELIKQFAEGHPPSSLWAGYYYGSVHIIFPPLFLLFRRIIYRSLGKHWLKQRYLDEATLGLELHGTAQRGSLPEVEDAISSKADLNAYCLSTEEDAFTLLHLAVFNEHHDAIQRLLTTGEVQVDKPTGSQGRTALFMAAQLGRLHALILLAEHHADLNAVADDEQSPIIVAAANGHRKVTAWLRKQGADMERNWHGVNVADAAHVGRGRAHESFNSSASPASHGALDSRASQDSFSSSARTSTSTQASRATQDTLSSLGSSSRLSTSGKASTSPVADDDAQRNNRVPAVMEDPRPGAENSTQSAEALVSTRVASVASSASSL
jgi:hypothetical protein